jgi:dephospho-CoA kinase
MITQPTPSTSGSADKSGPWKHGSIPVLGLIGAIGGGKSRAAAILAGRGALVIDADRVGHAALRLRRVRERLVERFGDAILDCSPGADWPAIDRRALGSIVFADPEALAALESVVHPLMRQSFERAIARAERRGKAPVIVLDAAILLEAGWHDLCDQIVFIDAPRDQRLARLATQRGWSADRLDAREQAQWPVAVKKRRADAVIINDGSLAGLEEMLDVLWSSMLSPPVRSDSSTTTDQADACGRGLPIFVHPTSRIPTFSQPADAPGRP